jgi:MoaA/NifB/PqqE/SkfB family radical SAM enzyme
MIKASDIERIDLGLVNRCNLACPLCPYVKYNIRENQKSAHADIDAVKNFLNKLPNIRVAIIEGNYSEPTLYKNFKELIQYLKSRNIRIRLSTNGNTFNTKWWSEIGPLFRKEDIIRFAIEGTTQELHSKYRIKGDLNKVLENHRAFKKTSVGTTILQNVIFQYNYHDQENIKKLFVEENFDFLCFQRCYPSENLNEEEGIAPLKEVVEYYKLYERIVHSKQIKKPKVVCDSDNRREIYINHEGQVFRCGVHDEEKPYENIPTVYDDIDTIFKHISMATENRHNCDACIKNCNTFCYKIGEYYADYIVDRNLNVYEENYFSMEIESKDYWNRDKLI